MTLWPGSVYVHVLFETVALDTVDAAPVFGQGVTRAAPFVLQDVVPGVMVADREMDEPFGPGTVSVGIVTVPVI